MCGVQLCLCSRDLTVIVDLGLVILRQTVIVLLLSFGKLLFSLFQAVQVILTSLLQLQTAGFQGFGGLVQLFLTVGDLFIKFPLTVLKLFWRSVSYMTEAHVDMRSFYT